MKSRFPLLVIFLTVFLDLVGFGLILPVAPFYAEHFHAAKSEVAFLGTAFSLMQFIFVPFWGRLSDRIGRRPVLLASVAGSAISMFVFGAARSYVWLLVARALAGAMTANFAVAQAYIADVTTPENRAKGMGVLGAAFGLGFILGPAVGGQLAKIGVSTGIGYGLVGYGSSALALVNLGLAWWLLPEPEQRNASRPRQSMREVITKARHTPGLPTLIVVFFVSTFAFANMEWTFALLTEARFGWSGVRGAQNNAYLFVLIGVIAVIVQGTLVGRLTRRFGERRLLYTGFALTTIGLGTLALMDSVALLVVACVLTAAGNSLTMPSMSSLVSRRSPVEMQGGVMGLFQASGSLARVFGPTSGGLLFQHVAPGAPFFTGATTLLLALIVALVRIREEPGKAVVTSSSA